MDLSEEEREQLGSDLQLSAIHFMWNDKASIEMRRDHSKRKQKANGNIKALIDEHGFDEFNKVAGELAVEMGYERDTFYRYESKAGPLEPPDDPYLLFKGVSDPSQDSD